MAKIGFKDKLLQASRRNDSLLCVGLDVDPARVPLQLLEGPGWIEAFNRGIIEAKDPPQYPEPRKFAPGARVVRIERYGLVQ